MTLLQYIKALNANFKSGDAREHSHRLALVELLKTEKGVSAINEPARIGGNAPDIKVMRGDSVIGFIETKDIGKALSRESGQLKRYRRAFSSLLLTDYLDWVWFVDGAEVDGARIGRVVDGKIVPNHRAQESWDMFIGNFLSRRMSSAATTDELAERLAGKTVQLKRVTRSLLKAGNKDIKEQYDIFRKVLVPNIDVKQFSDMFAQTIVYGLFTARRFSGKAEFSLERVADLIPETNPFLREFFYRIKSPSMHQDLKGLLNYTADFLREVDMDSVMRQQGDISGYEDILFHFYETFLAAYNPELRKKRGVYYTSGAVVDFIVRGADEILRTRFNLTDGIADKETIILDPAVGTATFLHRVVEVIQETQIAKGQRGAWNKYVKEHILPRVFGFELMMAPYAVAHLKLAVQLKDSGYTFGEGERLGIYLTNTLDQMQMREKSSDSVVRWLFDEAKKAEAVKNNEPVMVVLGNPPYAGHSENKTDFSKRLIESYKKAVPGLRKPGQAKWLSDDYVKFIGFAHWRVKQTGYGVVAFISNHAWLDNPTFRGMREVLLQDFDEIRILNLHGSTRRKEENPDGGKDQNVFDIQQGVAIFFLIRKKDVDHKENARVFHRDLWGRRQAKYDALAVLGVDDDGWKEIKPFAPLVLFKPVDEKLWREYEKLPSIKDIFSRSGSPAPGIVTTHDEFAISWTPEESADKVERLLATNNEREARSLFRLCSQEQWDYGRAKSELADGKWREKIVPILYRPFDIRSTVFDRNVAVHRRERVMRHMLGHENVGMVVGRIGGVDGPGEWCSVSISNAVVDFHILRSSSSCLFPLYIDPEADHPNGSLDNSLGSNIAREFLTEVAERLGSSPSPKEIFHYVYAVLHSPAYRKRYADFLKSEFPHLPLTADKRKFTRLAKLGAQLADLHLMRATAIGNLVTQFPETGNDKVEKIRYDEETQRVYINKVQFFGGIQKGDWDFFIGGYQVLDKWLKGRKNRILSGSELDHYQRIVTVIRKTRQLMDDVDKAIGEWPMT